MNQFFNCLLTKRCREYMNIRIARPKNRPMYLRRLIILKSHNNLKRADRNPVGSVEGMTAQTSDEAFLHSKISYGDERVGETLHKVLARVRVARC